MGREESEEEEVNADGWTELTDSMLYTVVDGQLRLGRKNETVQETVEGIC